MAIQKLAPDDKRIIEGWANSYFKGKANKRSTTNIPATLVSTGLIVRNTRPFRLTTFGERVAGAASAKEASEVFCRELIQSSNGMKVIEAVRELTGRGEPVTKKTLKRELERLGIEGLSTNTTDHTTLKNWMVEAGIFSGNSARPTINDGVLKRLIGISNTEQDEFGSLSLAQQAFLHCLRKRHEAEAGPFQVKDLLQEGLASYPHLFSEDQFAKAVRIPLERSGWIAIEGLGKGPQGGKSGRVVGTAKLNAIPISHVIPDFDRAIPGDLRARIRTPLEQILRGLESEDKHRGGLALELLALRMILDLRLEPRGFRLRSQDTAFAEVDLTAEGKDLLFSRWAFQCKRVTSRVGLSEVAKEVGIAIYTRAHVIAMVTTSDFTADAYDFAEQITRITHLQFIFIPGRVIKKYLREGPVALRQFVLENANLAMIKKRSQATWQLGETAS